MSPSPIIRTPSIKTPPMSENLRAVRRMCWGMAGGFGTVLLLTFVAPGLSRLSLALVGFLVTTFIITVINLEVWVSR